MKNRRTLLVGTVAALALAASACSAAPSESSDAGDSLKTGPGVTDDAISILAINDLSGPAASGGKPIQAGLDAYIEKLNAAGGIDGRSIKLTTADTQYDAQKAVQAYQGARDDIVAVWSYGTPTTDALRSFTDTDNKMLLALKGPFSEPNSFSVMNAFEVDTALLLSHVVEETPAAKIGVIYQADAMGEAMKRGVNAVIDETGIEIVAETTVDATSQDMTAQITSMRRAGADHIFLGVGPGALIAAAGAVAALDVKATLLNPGSGYTRSLLDLPVGPTLQENLLMTCSYPLWDDESPALGELKEALGDVEPHGSYVNGWQSGMILEGILREATEAGDLTPEGVIAAASGTTVDMQDLTPPVSYGESINDRSPYRDGRICSAAPDEDGFELIKDWFTSDAAQNVEFE